MNRMGIIGGGVVGLSIAWEFLRRGGQVVLIERGEIGRQASWAGAGMLPAANDETAIHPIEQLTAISNRLYPEWSAELQQTTGIDNGWRKCGGIHLARTAGEVASLAGFKRHCQEYQIPFETLDAEALRNDLPILVAPASIRQALWVPGEAQVRNPRHLMALTAACRQRGAVIVEHCNNFSFDISGDRVVGIRTSTDRFEFDQLCLAAGAWTGQIAERLGESLPMIPVRGQMLLFRFPHPPFQPIVNEGSRYIVPRPDGYVLVGSTTEEVGFDDSTTEEKLTELQTWVSSLFESFDEGRLARAWAGLRPASFDGFPYIGQLPRWQNVWTAAGHFKTGLQQAPATAIALVDWIETGQSAIDLSPFAPSRIGRLDAPLAT